MAKVPAVGRYELKYLLPTTARDLVVDLVAAYTGPDPHCVPLGDGRLGYHVHSLYLDTPDLHDYRQRLAHVRVRNRIRVRTYGPAPDGQPVFLENKRKSGPWVVKHRVPVCTADEWCSSGEPRPWTRLAERAEERHAFAASAFSQLADGERRQPVSVVHYEREVLLPRGADPNRVRLTLDSAVCATVAPEASDLYAAADVELIPCDWMVMELKFERYPPSWMQTLRRELRAAAVPLSKFGLSIARGLRAGHRAELRALMPPLPRRRKP
jgi:hypothetical protein